MPEITKLERQKHDKTRVSVFVDEEYAFSCKDEIIVEFNIKKGMNVNELPLEKIKKEDDFSRAYSYAYKSVLRSDKTEKQIFDALKKNEFEENIIEKVIERLKENDLINDIKYAEYAVCAFRGTGKRGIIYKLKQRGLSDEIINLAIEKIDEDDQVKEACELIRKKTKQGEDKYKQNLRIKRYLLQRGFEWDTIDEAMEKVFGEEE